MFHLDSVNLDDKLKFKTTHKGRTVYGGGGIMPDFFIPIDTSYYTNYYRSLLGKNLFREYALRYATSHREALQKMELATFTEEFEIQGAIEAQFLAYAAAAGISFVEEEYQLSKKVIFHELKAFIARTIWGDQGFYPIYHKIDGTFQKSLLLFKEAEKLAMRWVGDSSGLKTNRREVGICDD